MATRSQSLRVPYALAVHDEKEEERILRVLREKRTILGRETSEFEISVASYFGKKYGVMVNSGSSANLLAVELLNLPSGSEVITPILTFSTTVAPLVAKNLVPVFVDVIANTYQIDLAQVEAAITKKTKALMIPLLLGNVTDMERLRLLAKKYNLFIIEDSCDTLGATFKGKPTGTYTDISTTSFYGSHIITAGGMGGMVLVNSADWRDRAKVLRGWGRGSALIGESEDLSSRFKTKIDAIPYDAKFIFSEIGYNFLPAEICSAFGNAQIKKLPRFRKAREENFERLQKFFNTYAEYFTIPQQDPRVQTQWLAYPLTISQSAPFTRLQLVTYLEEHNIQTRPIFTGVITKQPGFKHIPYKTIQKSFPVAQNIMERGFVIGCHHGMENAHLQKLEEVFTSFIHKYG